MNELVSEQDLARARSDLAFRQQLLADTLEMLLAALNKMRRTANPTPEAAAQIREGVDLAVKLADRLQSAHHPGPKAA
jgi:hypothetical protein